MEKKSKTAKVLGCIGRFILWFVGLVLISLLGSYIGEMYIGRSISTPIFAVLQLGWLIGVLRFKFNNDPIGPNGLNDSLFSKNNGDNEDDGSNRS